MTFMVCAVVTFMVCAALSAPTRLIIERPRPDSLTKAAGRPRVDHGGRGADGGEPCARRFLGCTRIGCADSPSVMMR
jgi:hypothetical protein